MLSYNVCSDWLLTLCIMFSRFICIVVVSICCCSGDQLLISCVWSLWPHGLQHSRLSGPSPSPGACSNSCPLSRWCHPTISPSVIPFSSSLQSFPASGSFLMSLLFGLGGQSIGASSSASVLPMNIQDWCPLGWIGWIPCSPRDSQESSPIPHLESINSLALNLICGPTLTSLHDY